MEAGREDVYYIKSEESRKSLQYILEHGKFPPQSVIMVGSFVPSSEKAGKYSQFKFSMAGSNLYQAAEGLMANANMLLAQKNRKVSDILKTLGYILETCEEISAQLNLSDHPNARKFEQMLERIYKVRSPLEKIVQKDSNCTLARAAEEDRRIADHVEMSYRWHYNQFNPFARQMLDENPEFKGKIDEEFLTNLIINIPIVTSAQLHEKDLPSDMEPPKVVEK